MRTAYRPATVLILISTALVSAAFVPPFTRVAAVLWASAFAVTLVALVQAARASRRSAARHPVSRSWSLRSKTLVVVALVIVGAIVGALIVHTPSARAGALPAPSTTEPLAASPIPSAAQLVAIETGQSSLERLTGEAAVRLVRAARAFSPTPRSGLTADFRSARAFHYAESDVVSVPLVGTDLPDVSNLTYITTAGSTTVVENAARLIDENHVLYRSWSDDSMTHDVVLSNPDDSSQVPTSTRGFSMDKLKKCLNENGIAWAVLLVMGVACSAACATAVLCLPCVALYAGITGGALSKCVNYAFG